MSRLAADGPCFMQSQYPHPHTHNEALHLNKVSEGAAYLSKLGAQTMARFLECMPVSKAWLATRPRCLIRYSNVLKSHKHSDMQIRGTPTS